MDNRRSNIFTLFYILATAILLISICSQSSPLYPTNYWVDTNTIFTVGRNLDSKVMYRDLYDQKGPWMYFIYYAASLIHKDGFFGLYIIEIGFAFAFLFISYKALSLFSKKYSLVLLPIVAVVLYSCQAFMWGGSAEELTLPFNAYALYLLARAFKTNKIPTNKEFIAVGICAGLIFYIKYSLLGAMFGLVLGLFILAIFNGKLKLFFSAIWYMFLGFIISSIIPFIYFAYHGIYKDFYIGYIYNNIFLYYKDIDGVTSLPSNNLAERFERIRMFLTEARIDNKYAFLAVLASLVSTTYFTIRKNAKYTFIFILGFLFTFVIYSGDRRFNYYEFVFAVFAPLAVLPFAKLLELIEKKLAFFSSKYIYASLLVLSIAITIPLALRWTYSSFLMGVKKSELPQYKFAKIIAEYPKGNLLNVNTLDDGMYLAADIVPDRKNFCVLNANMKEIQKEHRKALENAEYMWIYAKYEPIDYPDYELAGYESYYYIPNIKTDYYLYKRKE